MKELYVFRHGETNWNAEGRFQGHMDIPLNERGREQARSLIERLRPYQIQAILSSDLSRALETARIAAEGIQVPVFVDPGLREAYLGGAQGLTHDEIVAQFGIELTGRWRSSEPTDADISYPGGETGTQVVTRVFAAMERFVDREPFDRIGISCHGGVIRRIMSQLRPPGSDPVRIPNVVLYKIHFDPVARKWHLPSEGELSS